MDGHGWPRFGGSSLNRWKFGPNRYLFISFVCLSVKKIFVSNYISIVHTISLGKKMANNPWRQKNFLQPIRWGSVHPTFFMAPNKWTCMCRCWVDPSNWWVSLKSTHLLFGFLFKIWMLGNWFNHATISFYFFGLSLAILYHEFSYHYEV
jgi:hypothetical protein